ncbi:glycosyltransferase [Lachnospiraceae bacterium CLA-AA-H183]|jgi:1,2-diacylglycerol 3-alpha-glucosyltransferase
MKICHLCLNGPYNEGWNYQENILPKYHVKQGHKVYQIVTPYMWEGNKLVVSHDRRYTNEAGVEIFRCKAKKGLIGGNRFNRYPEVLGLLNEIKPDILFIHDVQCLDITVVVNYLKKHRECTTYVDNHSDFSNSARNWLSKNILHKIIWKAMAKRIEPYVRLFYGVLPARVDFLIDMYKLPKDKCKLLVMGADDDLVEKNNKPEIRNKIRQKYNIKKDDFLIMTGGKIDAFKTQTLLLMEAVRETKPKNVKLIVFGSVDDNLKAKVDELADGEKVQYIGWIEAKESYAFFAAAELVVFPGRHSVFWEQVVGQGIPMVVKYWEGTTHVNVCGNVKFLYKDSKNEIEDVINEILMNDEYSVMKEKAILASKQFRYGDIARKSIET